MHPIDELFTAGLAARDGTRMVERIGALAITQGLACCDVTRLADAQQSIEIASGTYPVHLALVDRGSEREVAAARIDLAAAESVTWRKSGRVCRIESALVCFADGAANEYLRAHQLESWISELAKPLCVRRLSTVGRTRLRGASDVIAYLVHDAGEYAIWEGRLDQAVVALAVVFARTGLSIGQCDALRETMG